MKLTKTAKNYFALSIFIIAAVGFITYSFGAPLHGLFPQQQGQSITPITTEPLGPKSIRHIIKLDSTTNLTSFAVDGSGTFAGVDSGLRVVLKARQNGQEKNFLVFNKFNLTGSPTTFSFEGANIETSSLANVEPIELRWESNDSSTLTITHQTINTVATRGLNEPNFSSSVLKVIGGSDDTPPLQISKAEYLKQASNEINQSTISLTRGVGQPKTWTAARTNVTDKSFQQLSDLFAGDPPLSASGQEFGWYSEGVFNIGKTNSYKVDSNTTLPKVFDWRNWHGGNFVTSVKDQDDPVTCGSCWAFAAIASIESAANIRFNQPVDRDLSEQQLVTALPKYCQEGWPTSVYEYAKVIDILTEAEHPYFADSADHRTSVLDPTNHIQIIGSRSTSGFSKAETIIKNLIRRSPQTIWIPSLEHIMTIVGYDIDPEGYVTWHMKNSWGQRWGEEGYVRMTLSNSVVKEIMNPVIPYFPNNLTQQPACTDRDNDGYYFWGLDQFKPSSCPKGSSDMEDANDGDPTVHTFDTSSGLNTLLSTPGLTLGDLTVDNTSKVRNRINKHNSIREASVIRINFSTNYPDALNIEYSLFDSKQLNAKPIYSGTSSVNIASPNAKRTVDWDLGKTLSRGRNSSNEYSLLLKITNSFSSASKKINFFVTSP
ncbi:MAG: C1 family peptidase [Patescibacteria group bacterium]